MPHQKIEGLTDALDRAVQLSSNLYSMATAKGASLPFMTKVLDAWWLGLPIKLRRWSPTWSAVWADGHYLIAWPSLAFLLPLIALSWGIVEGVTHWSFGYTLGDGAISGTLHAVAFAQILPLLIVASTVGTLSARAGLLLVFGYAIGDFFVAGSAFKLLATARPIEAVGRLYVPQLISYFLFLLLAVAPGINAQLLVGSLSGLIRRTGRAAYPITVLCVLPIQVFFVYAWILAAPMVVRVLWIWGGRDASPMIVSFFRDSTTHWLLPITLVIGLLRAWLTFRAQSNSSVLLRLRDFHIKIRQCAARPSLSQRLPQSLRAIWAAFLMTALLSGLIYSVTVAVFMFTLIAAVLIVRVSILPRVPLWRSWAKIACLVPLIVRVGGAVFASWGLARLLLTIPPLSVAANTKAGAFGTQLLSIVAGLVVTLILIPDSPSDSSPETSTPLSPTVLQNAARLIIGAVVLAALFGNTVLAECVEPACCFQGNELAALSALAILLMVYTPLLGLFFGTLVVGLVLPSSAYALPWYMLPMVSDAAKATITTTIDKLCNGALSHDQINQLTNSILGTIDMDDARTFTHINANAHPIILNEQQDQIIRTQLRQIDDSTLQAAASKAYNDATTNGTVVVK